MSDVRSSILRWTIEGWAGIGGVIGRATDFAPGLAGSMVIARREGRDGCTMVPSRRISP